MFKYKQGDILKADTEALVNTVNCVGVMGRGIALQFRKKFPDNYRAYKIACKSKKIQPGKVFVFNRQSMFNPKYIINFPTKIHWRNNSRLEHIKEGLKSLVKEIKIRNIHSVAIPPLGCGLGGLNWKNVKPEIEKAFLGVSDVEVYLYEPSGAPSPREMAINTKKPNMTVGRAALLGLMRRYLAGSMDPFVTLLEIHKLMYFLSEAGENLRLSFRKAPYGPYAVKLRHVLNRIEGHFIVGYGDAEDNPRKQINLIPEASEKAEKFLEKHENTIKRFNRVSDLIDGFETSFGMELLSTVHWVATFEGASDLEKVIEKTYAWNPRKRMFHKDQIRVAWENLQKKDWI